MLYILKRHNESGNLKRKQKKILYKKKTRKGKQFYKYIGVKNEFCLFCL